MVRLPFSYLSAYKRELRAALADEATPPLPSGHLSEALAAAAGFRTHAALTQTRPRAVSLDATRFWTRLADLGHVRPCLLERASSSFRGALPGDDLMPRTAMGLGYSPDQAHALAWMRQQPIGAVVVMGPAGSGKTTTVASLFPTPQASERKAIDAPSRPTISDGPAHATVSPFWQAALQAAMRADPERLVLGEIRDASTAKALLEVIQTGRSVWTTMHGADLVSAFGRLRVFGLLEAHLQWPDLLSGLVHQHLVGVLCPHCSRPLDSVGGALQTRLAQVTSPSAWAHLRQRGEGCARCHEGYVHRTVVAAVASAQDGPLTEARVKHGPLSLAHAIEKMHAGLLDPHDVEARCGHLDQVIF